MSGKKEGIYKKEEEDGSAVIEVGAVKVKVAQSCLTLCDPVACAGHGNLQARMLEWVAFLFSSGSSQPRDQIRVSCVAGRFSIS